MNAAYREILQKAAHEIDAEDIERTDRIKAYKNNVSRLFGLIREQWLRNELASGLLKYSEIGAVTYYNRGKKTYAFEATAAAISIADKVVVLRPIEISLGDSDTVDMEAPGNEALTGGFLVRLRSVSNKPWTRLNTVGSKIREELELEAEEFYKILLTGLGLIEP
jgi:hypothetical protein